jgi:pimeloyl-ACP methyl ester carboxylesterase
VIAVDGRDQGKSGDSQDKITYEKMTDDLAALLEYVKTGPANVLGRSNGGIEALASIRLNCNSKGWSTIQFFGTAPP